MASTSTSLVSAESLNTVGVPIDVATINRFSSELFIDDKQRSRTLEESAFNFFMACKQDAAEVRDLLGCLERSLRSMHIRADHILKDQLTRKFLPTIILAVEALEVNLNHMPVHGRDHQRFDDAHAKLQSMLAATFSWLDSCTDKNFLESFHHVRVKYDGLLRHAIEGYAPQRYVMNLFDSRTKGPLSINFMAMLKMADAEGVLLDVDDCIIWSEHRQLPRWLDSIDLWATDVRGITSADRFELKRVIHDCFTTDNASLLMPRLYDFALERGYLPEQVKAQDKNQAIKELDRYLTEFRQVLLLNDVATKDISLTDGVITFLKKLKQEKIPVGICTSSPKPISRSILLALFDRQGLKFDSFVPEQHQTFGDEVPVRKPYPIQWLIGAERIGVAPSKVLVMDNSHNNVTHVAELGSRYADDRLIQEKLAGLEGRFACAAGVVNSGKHLPKWLDWLGSLPSQRPVTCLLKQFNQITY